MEGGWIRCGQWRGRDVHWWRNPRRILPAPWLRAVTLWRQSQGGMARGWLAEPGGINAQPAWLVDAFGILAAEEHRMDKRRTEKEPG